jgi:LysM repeat protein
VSVPEKPQSYAVAPRDTLYAIAQRTCTSTAELITLNALTAPNKLKPGQMLALPDNHCLER